MISIFPQQRKLGLGSSAQISFVFFFGVGRSRFRTVPVQGSGAGPCKFPSRGRRPKRWQIRPSNRPVACMIVRPGDLVGGLEVSRGCFSPGSGCILDPCRWNNGRFTAKEFPWLHYPSGPSEVPDVAHSLVGRLDPKAFRTWKAGSFPRPNLRHGDAAMVPVWLKTWGPSLDDGNHVCQWPLVSEVYPYQKPSKII